MHTAKLFQYGCSQAVRLPADYRFDSHASFRTTNSRVFTRGIDSTTGRATI